MLKITQEIKLLDKYGRANKYCIYGPPRSGKTVLALMTVGELMGDWSKPMGNDAVKHFHENGNLDWEDYVLQRDVGVLENPTYLWENLEKFVVWRPDEFLDRLDRIIEEDRKLPCFIWDDAGYWLCNFDWGKDFQKMVGRYMQLFGVNFTALIFTSLLPTDIIGKISRNKVEMRTVRIEYNGYSSPWSRICKMYSHNMCPDLQKSNVSKPDIMYLKDVRCLGETYTKYLEKRKTYNRKAAEDMRALIKDVLAPKAAKIYKKASEAQLRPDDGPKPLESTGEVVDFLNMIS